jgi:hypothetical protein
MNTKNKAATLCEQSTKLCSYAATYETWMNHCLRLAKHPGWKAHIWWRVQDLDSDRSGLFTGFKDDFLRRIKDDDGSISSADSPNSKG